MQFPTRHHLVLAISVIAIAIASVVWWPRPVTVEPFDSGSAMPKHHLSMLAVAPDWSLLDAYQGTITRPDFERLLSTIYTAGDGWKDWIQIDLTGATIDTGDGVCRIEFGAGNREVPGARYWRRPSELPPPPVARPLHGLHVAIDPGHIGGQWARMEERWLSVDGGDPICEGDMTLQVARLLEERLVQLGARVSLVREGSQPVTRLRPADLMKQAARQEKDSERARRLAQRWFYRTAEIRARSKRVNREIQPDLVLCLHFNAEAWGNPESPTLVDRSHVHMLVHGGYGDDELAYEDQRHAMLLKLLSGSHREEARLARETMKVFSAATGLPAYQYASGSKYVRPVPDAPGVWARNLLANRLFECPVLFLEPYVMNSRSDYPRMQAGDFAGVREVAGRPQVSIFREYAESVCAGLVRHYSAR